MASQTNPISQKLHSIPISDFVQKHDIYTVNTDDAVETAIQTMQKTGVHSCPVMNSDNQCVGVVDMLDVINHIVSVAPNEDQLDQQHLETAGRAICLANVGSILFQSKNDPFVPLEENEPSTVLVDFFAKGVHRSPIFNSENQVVGTVSQSDVVNWIHEQSTTYLKKWSLFERPIQVLGLGQSQVVTVDESQTMLEALKLINSGGHSALAVTDAYDKLVGNISATNFVNLSLENLPSFNISVEEYLKTHSPNSLSNESIDKNSTLQDALDIFAKSGHHRVWVTDEGKPIGVITHTDIMKLVSNYNDTDVVSFV